jgi:hypothetical protein
MTAESAENVLPFNQKLTATFVSVTPEIAARWLTKNTRNRALRKSEVTRYKRDMLAGKWRLDGSPIRFAADGTLLDGQNRLTAIVEAGVTVPLLVVRGVAPEAQNVMDTGRKRSAGDALAINGYGYYSSIAATAKMALQIQAGRIWDGDGGSFQATHDEILTFVRDNPDVVTACEFVSTLARKTDCRPTVVSYTYWVLRRINERDAAEFWVGVAEKAGLNKGDPVLTLANRLAEARRSNEFFSTRVLLSMIYRAWNAKRDGRSLMYLPNSRKGAAVAIPTPH